MFRIWQFSVLTVVFMCCRIDEEVAGCVIYPCTVPLLSKPAVFLGVSEELFYSVGECVVTLSRRNEVEMCLQLVRTIWTSLLRHITVSILTDLVNTLLHILNWNKLRQIDHLTISESVNLVSNFITTSIIKTKLINCYVKEVKHVMVLYRGAGKTLAWPTSRCILFDVENILCDASLVMCINSTNIPPIMMINRIYKHQNHLLL